MRLMRHNFLFVLGLMLTLGVSAAIAGGKQKKAKIPKKMGALSVQTTPVAYPVKVDGKYLGMSGVGSGVDFYLAPGFHTVEVTGPGGKTYTREVEIRKGVRECICLKGVEETITKDCPYRFVLDGPRRVTEGDPVTFKAINKGTAPIPLRYVWRVVNGRITSGQGTPVITVDSSGMGGKTIEAELDVNDAVYDSRCREVISVPTDVEPIKEPPPILKIMCDQFDSISNDDDKARLDNCMIMAQNTPDSQLYVVIYPGTDRMSRTRNTYERVSKRSLDYLIKRGMDPSRIKYVRGSNRTRTAYEIWIVPAGAEPPVVQ
ncbi:MAG: PEGA domain-containing protein [Acidobacteria bacterium]|nr:PEGA domain-containing protein [Acidobacteriota bacterium]